MQCPIDFLSFAQLVEHFSLFDSDVLALLGVDKRTLKKWLRDNTAPDWARKLVTIHGRGYLPPSKDWAGFRFRDDKLFTPDGRSITSGEILGWFYRNQLIETYKRNNQKLRRHNDRIKLIMSSSNDSIFREDGTLKETKTE